MENTENKKNEEQVKELNPEELSKVNGGASFDFYDREKRRPVAEKTPPVLPNCNFVK